MPQYLLSIWHDEPYDDIDLDSPEAQRRMAQVDELNADARSGRGVGVRHGTAHRVVSDRRARRRPATSR